MDKYTKAVLAVVVLIFTPLCNAEKLMTIDAHVPLWEQSDFVACFLYRSHACAGTYPENKSVQNGCYSFPKETVHIFDFRNNVTFVKGAESDASEISAYNFKTSLINDKRFSVQQVHMGRRSFEFSVTEVNEKGQFPALRLLVNLFQNGDWDSIQTNLYKLFCEAHTN